jgi:hypothetical protein
MFELDENYVTRLATLIALTCIKKYKVSTSNS